MAPHLSVGSSQTSVGTNYARITIQNCLKKTKLRNYLFADFHRVSRKLANQLCELQWPILDFQKSNDLISII